MENFCPVCKSEKQIIIGKAKTNSLSVKFINKDYNIVRCKNCKSYFVAPKIEFTGEQWSELYNSEYFSDQSELLVRRRSKELKKRFDKAAACLNSSHEIKFLDLGTGEGRTLTEAVNRGWEATGIDIVDNRIDKQISNKIKFVAGKFLDLEFPENYFDIIYIDSVLEHVLEPLEYLIKAKKILKHGGIIYIGVPNEDSLFNDIRRLIFNLTGRGNISEKLKPFDTPYHVVGFNFHSLKYLIRLAGMEIKYIRSFGRKFDFLSFSPHKKGFWISLLFLLPVEIIGYIINRDVYLEAYLSK